MRPSNFLFIIIVLIACNSKNKKQPGQLTTEEKWETTFIKNRVNTYRKSGLLDTTYQTETFYFSGEIANVFDFLILRIYDRANNLINEKTIQILNHNKLSEEKIMKYDSKRNLTQEIENSDNVCDLIRKKIYNNLNQEIRSMEIRKILEAYPKGWNADSAVAHYYDNKPTPKYDTMFITSLYYKQGKVIEKLYSGPNLITEETQMTLYSKRQKIFTYGINSNGDTVSLIKYEKDGNLIKEISEDKASFVDIITWYDGDRKVKTINYFHNKNCKRMETYRYDIKGNEIENVSSNANCN